MKLLFTGLGGIVVTQKRRVNDRIIAITGTGKRINAPARLFTEAPKVAEKSELAMPVTLEELKARWTK